MNLHSDIMNIQIDEEDLKANLPKASFAAYKVGHRDARHAAAELSLKAEARIEELENILNKLLFSITPVSNAAYNLAWQHRDEQSVHRNIGVLDELRTQAYKLLEGK
jgi:hypothetical protein